MLSAAQVQSARASLGITPQAAPTQNRASELTAAWSSPAPQKDPIPSVHPHDTGAPIKTPLETIKEQFQSGVDQAKQGASEVSSGGSPVQGLESGLKTEAGIATAVTAPLAPVFKPLATIIGDIGDKIGSIKAVQDFANSDAGKVTARVAEDLSNAGAVAGTIAGADQVAKAAPGALDKIQGVASNVKDSVSQALQENTPKGAPESAQPSPNDSAIIENYTRAIKPTIAGKKSPALIQKYNNDVVGAVKTIVQNKDSLSFTDEAGNPETGRLPQTPMEFSQALDQTKANVFKQYDSLAQLAGEKGAAVDSEPIAGSLDKVVNSEALKVTNPAAVKYAADFKSRLVSNPDELAGGADPQFKQFSAQDTQDIIKTMNSNLEAFYKNPSYDSASKIAIDAGIVRQFRESLGKAIESATGENYQAIKNQYGALSAIEKDVSSRAVVLARQQTVGSAAGLGKYMDVFAGGDLVNGLLSLNPGLFARGVALPIFTRFFQYLNSPDRAIQNMFKAATQSANVK